ncbi:CheR family methyltransferase [Legionella jamestowniensis]|uniref:Methyltransferase involved in chemotaxis (CheR domain) n=1 Tax=Legionella jamestowniensis TaxID=455 RepID=A0A0W0UNG4_9GAMM|nr:protein-glutamate O-methyltransferase CheR [Legionella jamestowniensis]KTD09425.1 methyltransferase involved in chemotaxis (CheR domain) [Legionella jamestowniensis]OCH99251.1 hypothetical protein A8135_08380 [Legionella jamestowniensis]SFL89080.1 Methylase of chemotaxis methyl-accepting proteins [Legionella jamestowniensis DSM 19215]
MTNVIESLKAWAVSHYGINILDHQIESVMHRIANVMTTLEMTETEFLLALNANHKSAVEETIAAITVPESYFFRDSSLFAFLKNKLFPQLIKIKTKQVNYQFNIWSAGCSYGEEVYSIAICLHQLIADIKQWNINLIGTDINYYGLEKAKKGIFNKASMRAIDNLTLSNYFTKHDSTYFLNKNIRDMVKFAYGNIAKMEPMNEKFDAIFCRNVFIYLDKDVATKALDFFYENLVDGGVLFLSPADYFVCCSHKFSVQIVDNLCMLKKETTKKQDIIVNKKEERSDLSYSENQKERATRIHEIRTSLDGKDYLTALKNIHTYIEKFGVTGLLYRCKGEALLGLGENTMAIVFLTKAIKLDPCDATAFFLKGLVELDMKQNDAAEISLNKALSIKPDFPEAAYYLGLYYLQNQERKRGLELLLHAAKEAKKMNKETSMLFSSATAAQFTQAVKLSISYYQGIEND